MKIRKAEGSDFNKIFHLFKTEYGKPPYNEKWTRQGTKKTLEYYSKIGEIFVGEVNNEVTGLIILKIGQYNTKQYVYIEEIIVSEKEQGKGQGRKFMEFAGNYAKKNKVAQIELLANEEAKAYHFYKRIGYTPRKESLIFFSKKI